MKANDIIQYEQLLNRIEKINQNFGLRIYMYPISENNELQLTDKIMLENRIKYNLTNILFQANDVAELIIFLNGFEMGLLNKK